MADKTTELERIYTIPLRKAHHGTRSKRTNRAIRDVRSFLAQHMKSDEIWIAGDVNETLWTRGKFRIPSRIRVRATRFNDGVVEVTLPDSSAEGSVRDAIQERQEKAAETPVLVAPTDLEGLDDDEEGRPHTEADHHPVTDIEGIGPATAEKLEKIEVESVGDLLAAGEAAVAAATGKTEEVVAGWFEQAKAMAVPHAHDSEE
jgi:large subunit ribosomal protein L31e